MSNVIAFPKNKLNTPAQSLDDIDKQVETYRMAQTEKVILLLADELFDNIVMAGFDITEEIEEYSKDISLIIESVRSLMYKYNDLPHQFHEVTDKLLSLQKDGSIVISDDAIDKFLKE